jgi:two-component system chemotaxis response regulator CheY
MKKTVLIVDDSSSLRQVVNLALSRAGYEVLEGCDGRDGLTKLDGRKVHLIVSDVNMPRMDGLTFLTAVKALPNYRFTPVIMLTTESGDAKKDAGRAAGARAWIVKPFNPPVLLDAVAKLCLP